MDINVEGTSGPNKAGKNNPLSLFDVMKALSCFGESETFDAKDNHAIWMTAISYS